MKKQFYKIAVLVLVSFAVANVQMVNAQNTDSNKTKELSNITIKALTNSSKAPFTKTVITNAELQVNNNGADLPILIQNVCNAVSSSDAGTGTGYTGLRLRGSDLTRINVTINGVPVNDAESQNTFFTDIPDLVSSAQNITIQRGVGSSTNGTGAFGGSIHINTIQLPEKKSLVISNTYGTFNTVRNSIKWHSGNFGKYFNASLRLSHISSNGYIQRSNSKLFGGQFTLAYTPNVNTQIIANYIKGHEKTGQAWNGVEQDSLLTNRTFNMLGIKEDGTYYDNQTDNYGQDYFQLIINKKINHNWKLNITPYTTLGRGYYEEYKVGASYSAYNLPYFIQNTDTLSETNLVRQLWLKNENIGAIANVVYTNKNISITNGINVSTYLGKHFGKVIWDQNLPAINHTWYNLNSTKSEISGYSKFEYNATKKLFLFADAQIRKVIYNINGFRSNPEFKQNVEFLFFNPKLGASMQLTPKHNAYASVAVANREPNRDDLETNTAPKHERLINTELGYNYKSKKGWYKANIYHMLYKNQLVLTGQINDVGAYTRTNVANSYRLGLEMEVSESISNYLALQANIAISRNKIKSLSNYIDDYDNGGQVIQNFSNTDIAFSPNFIAGYGATILPFYGYGNKDASITLQHKFVGAQFLDNTSDASKSISAFNFLDVTTMYRAGLNEKYLFNFKFGINNLLGTKFSNNGYTYSYIYGGLQSFNFYFPQAKQRFWVGVDVQL